MVLDLRSEDMIYPGNRFLIYALYPNCAISMHVLWGRQKQNVVFAVGKSIFNRSSKVNIGELMLRHGGGGHSNAGTCQVEVDRAEGVLEELTREFAAG
jgi:nanoRNase/pAp phosphatase (c-di-AMP/oligoRNAs hydrolase)